MQTFKTHNEERCQDTSDLRHFGTSAEVSRGHFGTGTELS